MSLMKKGLMQKMEKKSIWNVFDCVNFSEFMLVYGWAILVVIVAIGAWVWFEFKK